MKIVDGPSYCPSCGVLALHKVHGHYVFVTPPNIKPDVMVVDNVEWETCFECKEDILGHSITSVLDEMMKRK